LHTWYLYNYCHGGTRVLFVKSTAGFGFLPAEMFCIRYRRECDVGWLCGLGVGLRHTGRCFVFVVLLGSVERTTAQRRGWQHFIVPRSSCETEIETRADSSYLAISFWLV